MGFNLVILLNEFCIIIVSESSPALPEAPVESITEETVHASIPADTPERPATPEPVEQSTDATQEDVPSDSDVDVTTVTEEETHDDEQETLPYEAKHTGRRCYYDAYLVESFSMFRCFLTYIYLREHIINIYKYSNILSSYSYIS